MRLSHTIALVLSCGIALPGCFSSWSGDVLPTLGSVPHWPDCDGDGWGDGTKIFAEDGTFDDLMECMEVDPIQGPDQCRFVENNLDCDDSYAESGADTSGQGCPDQYGWMFDGGVTPADYAVLDDNVREYLVFAPAVGRLEAADICADWALGALDSQEIAELEELIANGEILPDLGGVATLENSGQLRTAEEVIAPFGEVTLWVGARFATGSDSQLVWDLPVEAGTAELIVETSLLPYCDSQFELVDVYNLNEGVQGSIDGAQSYRDTMLTPIRFGGVEACVVRPSEGCAGADTVGGIPDPSVCPQYGVLCERPSVRPSVRIDFRLAPGYCDNAG
ncbi:MAG: hypothetical protein H6734_25750 [Alphaproteobacteria bacterium]|nr:hypothetical protein [Alphaproteobacteria bacterium]